MARKKQPAKNSTPRVPEQQEKSSALPGSDDLLDAALTNWPHILMMYRLCAAKRPVMLYDIQEARVYAYPYLEFKQELSERSQQTLTAQYERALHDGMIVVFVRDNVRKLLRSFSLDPEMDVA